MAALFGGVILYLGCIYAWFAAVSGTCTQFAADQLLGGVLSGVLYVIGLALVIARPPRRLAWLFYSPIAVAFVVQAWWATGFFVAYHFNGISACGWTHGPEYTEMDGREPFFTAWWLGMSLICCAGLVWAWLRSRRLPSQS